MESQIVQDFEKLRMFAAYDYFKMDELVHDLSNALEESARCKSKSRSNDYTRKIKRRCKKRKSHANPMVAWELGNMSEASESSLDEAIKDYMETMAQQSDSDDLLMSRHHLSSLAALTSNTMLSLPESDSVNENFSPMRPHRRRRRYKRMAVDPQNPRQVQEFLDACGINSGHICREHMCDAAEPIGNIQTASLNTTLSKSVLGKRKRGVKDRSNNGCEVDNVPEESACSSQNSMEASTQHMESNCMSESGTSSLSSNESEGLQTNDESRDGDDEQSDFFHETGPVCGVPGISPWWQKYTDGGGTSGQGNPSFESILKGSLEHMSSAAKRNFQAKLMMGPPSRPYRSGRRHLKDLRSVYSLSCFLHDRQQWAEHLKKLSSPRSVCSSSSSSRLHDPKRHKKTPTPSPDEDEMSSIRTDPGSDSNISCHILQNMVCNQGSGADLETSTMMAPSSTCRRTRRQGLVPNSSSQSVTSTSNNV